MNKEQYKTYLRQALNALTESHNSKHVAQGHQLTDSGDLLDAIGDSPTEKSVHKLFHSAINAFDRKQLHDFTKEDLKQYSRAEKIAIATGSGMTHLHPDYDPEKHGTGKSVIGVENLDEK